MAAHALHTIGGFQYGSLTKDANTSYVAHIVVGAVSSGQVVNNLVKRQKEVTDVEPDYWASPVQYASLQVLEQAITSAGSLDKQAVIDAIGSGTFDTIMGEWKFEGNIIRQFWTVGQWQDGHFKGVASTGLDGEAATVLKQGWK